MTKNTDNVASARKGGETPYKLSKRYQKYAKGKPQEPEKPQKPEKKYYRPELPTRNQRERRALILNFVSRTEGLDKAAVRLGTHRGALLCWIRHGNIPSSFYALRIAALTGLLEANYRETAAEKRLRNKLLAEHRPANTSKSSKKG